MKMAEAEIICEATKQVVKRVNASLDKAKTAFKNDPEEWIENGVSKDLGPNIGSYAAFYTSLGVQDQAGLHQLFKKNFKNVEVQERYEELLEVEDDWNSFLDSADTALSAGLLPPLKEGELITDKIVLNTVGGAEVDLHELSEGATYLHLILLRHFA
eukprot:TRINITY_DN21273_c0_g1_i1.p1 TRINITY_DN21273_c0_g1~~TRINITY_DN21273_c0_g1_i1.p1  ORF type:complete len:157 (+),score=36.71 TRINITY_DN21273_c0_g1_i1:67-537(+)